VNIKSGCYNKDEIKMASTPAILGGEPARTKPFASWPIIEEADERRLLSVLRSGKWWMGEHVRSFEKSFAEYHGTSRGIAVTNGSVSLKIALQAIGIEAGDEVIVPPYTFFATAAAVVEANATPIFADIDPDTLTISPQAIERVLTPRTRAIIPVHLGGLAADMDAIMTIARRHHLRVIEDCAHAHGAEYKGRKVGSIGDIGSFSFQMSKNMTSGEGGILITSNSDLADMCDSLHHCGRMARGGEWYDHQIIGGNYRMGEFQAALLLGQLERLEAQSNVRELNAAYLIARMKRIPGISPQRRGQEHTRHGYHLFLVRFDESVYKFPREVFLKAMQAEGIPLIGGYTVPLYRQSAFTNLAFGPFTGYRIAHPDLDYEKVDCPVCERICTREGTWFPHTVLLGDQRDMDSVADAFEKVYAGRAEIAANAEKLMEAF
jgi:dTDP-4-amino-4,6-dideoxygalactose transaminase